MYSIDIDVGGTFTDGYFSADGDYQMVKTFTTPYDLTECVMACVAEGAEAFGLPLVDFLRSTTTMRLSTTLGTNTLLERRGPKIGLLVTRGHEYDLYAERPYIATAILSQDIILGVDEETSPDGSVVKRPDAEQILAQVRRLIHAGARNIGVGFAGSARNPANEEYVRRVILDRYPENYLRSIPIQLSHEVSANLDDHARLNTLIVNCYLHSGLARGLYRCEDQVRKHGLMTPLLIVHADGGCARVAKTVAVQTLSSGPAAAVHGAGSLARQLGHSKVLTMDMGGTSLDVSTLKEGVPARTETPEVLNMRLAIPMTATESIAAGGGSIASVLEGVVEVGPESAGATPGPACYGRGGRLPTVTDANLVLGYLGDGVLGGRLKLDYGLAKAAMERSICSKLDVSVDEAANRIRRRVDENMAAQIRRKLERDDLVAAEVVLFAVGGGGPVHACAVAALAGIREVHGFPFGPVFSAFGSSTLDVLHRYRLGSAELVRMGDATAAAEVVARLMRQAELDLRGEGLEDQPKVLSLNLTRDDHGNSTGVVFEMPAGGVIAPETLRSLIAPIDGAGPVTTMFLEARVELDPWTPVLADPVAHIAAPSERHQVNWNGRREEAAVYELERLRAGARLEGPAVLKACGTSFVVPVKWTCQIDGLGNPVMRLHD